MQFAPHIMINQPYKVQTSCVLTLRGFGAGGTRRHHRIEPMPLFPSYFELSLDQMKTLLDP